MKANMNEDSEVAIFAYMFDELRCKVVPNQEAVCVCLAAGWHLSIEEAWRHYAESALMINHSKSP